MTDCDAFRLWTPGLSCGLDAGMIQADPSSANHVPRVVIIGGGFSGAVLAWHLHRTAPHRHHIVIVEPRDEIGRGLAYDSSDPAHRITVRHRLGFMTPGFWIGDGKDVILWGFTAGIIARLFEFLGWIQDMPDAPATALPDYMYPENDPRRTAAAGPIDDEVAE